MSTDRHLTLVTGASGWIGRQVCQQLRERSATVAAFVQVASAGPWAEAFVGTLDCFRDPPEELRRLLARTVTVVHCAGRAHQPVETPEEVASFEQTNVAGTRGLLAACGRAGVRRIVYVSTIAGYDWTAAPPDGICEDGLLGVASAYARTKLEGERHVRESGLDWRVARLATVFGTGDRGNFARFAGLLKRGRVVVPGRGEARKSVLPVDLAAEVLARLALVDEPRHRLTNAALPEAPTLRQLCDGFSAACGFARAHSAPFGLLQVGAMAGDLVARVRSGFPLTSAMLEKLTVSTVVNSKRLYETFPDFPRPTFAQALESAVEFYRGV